MKSTELYNVIQPFNLLSNKNALSVNYRALHISPTFIKGCSAFGVMQCEVATGIDKDIYVDAATFLDVMRSLPSDKDIVFEAKDTTLSWKCDRATGHFAYLAGEIKMPDVPRPNAEFNPITTSFAKALDLGSLACGTTALLSVGLYGIVINNGDDLKVYASNNATMSTCKLGSKLENVTAENATLSPEAAAVLIAVSSQKEASIFIDAETIYCDTPTTKLAVKQIAALKVDIKAATSNFSETKLTIPLDRDTVSAFIRRSEALADDKDKTMVSISVEEGQTKLGFSDGTSSNTDFYVAEGAKEVSVEPILVETKRLAKALSSSASIAFDYAKMGVLVLRGDSDFMFVISGRKPNETMGTKPKE
jgi:hypothetical protein